MIAQHESDAQVERSPCLIGKAFKDTVSLDAAH